MIKDKKSFFKETKFKNSLPIVTGRNFQKYSRPNCQYFDLSKSVIFGGTKKPQKHEVCPKILVRKTGNSLIATFDNEGIWAEQSVYLVLPKSDLDLRYVLGILNSNLITYYFRNKLITNPEAYPYIQHYDLEVIPIKNIDKTSAVYKGIIKKVDNILSVMATDGISEKKRIKILSLEIELNRLVYKAYNVTVPEISTIEECLKK